MPKLKVYRDIPVGQRTQYGTFIQQLYQYPQIWREVNGIRNLHSTSLQTKVSLASYVVIKKIREVECTLSLIDSSCIECGASHILDKIWSKKLFQHKNLFSCVTKNVHNNIVMMIYGILGIYSKHARFANLSKYSHSFHSASIQYLNVLICLNVHGLEKKLIS